MLVTKSKVILFTILGFLLIPFFISAQPIGKGITSIMEEDTSPEVYPWQIKVTNGILTDNGDGTASLAISGSGDMTKAVYDTDANDKVDTSDRIGTLTNTKWCNTDGSVINCTENAPAGAGDITAVGTCTDGSCGTEGGNDIFPFIYEGTANDFETTFAVTDTTTPDKTITFPNATGTVAVSATAPATLSVAGDIGITVLKDLVTTAPLTGGTNDILVGADADITIAIPQATTSADGYVIQADWDSWTDHVADNSQAHSDYVINTGDTITGAVTINDNDAAGSTLLTIGDATDADSVAIFGDLTVTGGDITLGTSAIFSGGDTTSLNLIDAIDATTETTLEGALDIAGEVTSTGMGSTVIADSVAVSSWNLTTPTITTSLTTSTPTTLTAAELDRLDGLTSVIIDDDKIDTFAELDAIVADKALVNKADGAVWLGVHDFGGATSVEIPNAAAPTVDATGEIAIDTTADQIKYYGASSARAINPVQTRCSIIPNTTAADDNFPMGSFNDPVTITGVWCTVSGTGTTKATFTLEDGSGNAMTITGTNPTCEAIGTVPNVAAVTAGNQLTARESLRFDVTNTPDPATDTYELCVSFTCDAQ